MTIFRMNDPFLSPSDYARIRYLNFYYIICVFLIPFYFVANAVMYKVYDWIYASVPLFGFFLITPLMARVFKSYKTVAFWAAMLTSTILVILLWGSGGVNSPGLIWISAIPMTFAVMLGRFGGYVGSGYMVFIVLSYHLLDQFGFKGTIQFTPESYLTERNLNIVTFGLFTVLTVNYFIRNEEASNREIENQKREVENLLRVLIHDIATPVMVSQMSIEGLLKAGDDQEKIQKQVARIRSSNGTISTILSEVRTIRGLRDGKLNLSPRSVTVKSVIREALIVLNAVAEQKDIRIEIQIDEDDLSFLVDEAVFKIIIFSNLITNAIKFSPKGSVIKIQAQNIGDRVQVSVRDYGLGIPPQILDGLWSLRKQTTRVGTQGEVGTGYGMPLVREFVDILGGTIQVRTAEMDEPDFVRGTEFVLRFPRAEPQSS